MSAWNLSGEKIHVTTPTTNVIPVKMTESCSGKCIKIGDLYAPLGSYVICLLVHSDWALTLSAFTVSASSLNALRKTLPTLVFCSSERNSICLGIL